MANPVKIILGIDDPPVVIREAQDAPEGTDVLIITKENPAGVIPWFNRPGVHMFFGQPVNAMVELMQSLAWQIATGKCDVIRRSDDPYYQDILDTFEPELNCFRLNMFCHVNNGDIIQQNVFQNIPRFRDCAAVKNLRRGLNGTRVICVAAGPSLDQEIQDLQWAQGEIPIIAVDTALRPLQAAGITPDIACALDYSVLNLKKLAYASLDCPLVALPAVHPDMIRLFREAGQEVFISYKPNPFYDWMNKNVAVMGEMPFQGCVGVMAFELARYMGAGEVVLVGYDFGYPRKQSHAKNSMHDNTGLEVNRMLPGVNGLQVQSNDMFAGLLTEMERSVSADSAVKRVINASRGGACIKWTESRPGLQKALESKETFAKPDMPSLIAHAASGKAAPGSLHRVKRDLRAVCNLAVAAQADPGTAKDCYNAMIERKNVLELLDLSLASRALAIDSGTIPGSQVAQHFQAIEEVCNFYLEVMA